MVVDFHLHYSSGQAFDKWDDDVYFQMLDEAGIRKGVIFTIDGFYTERYEVENNLMYETAMRFPDRLVPFCSVNPKQGVSALRELRRCLEELKMPGIKFHPWFQGFHPISPEMEAICEMAGHYHAPILFHDGTPPNSGPLAIGWLAEKFPETTFILGHGGLFDLWLDAISVVNRNSNVYVCLCGTAPEGIFRKVAEGVPADKLLFGTDGGFGSDTYMTGFRTRIAQEMALDEDVREKWLYKNAIKLLSHSNDGRWGRE